MNGKSEEMFIHFACYRGEGEKRGLMLAALLPGEEPMIVEMCKENIPRHIIGRLHDHEVRKYYILPYDIFSEMLKICNIRRCQGQGTWISIGRRLAWLGIRNEQEADIGMIAEMFPESGRMIKKFEKDFMTLCYPDRYFGKMCNPDIYKKEWENMKKYMSAVVLLEQEFINWCRIHDIDFLYEKICCRGLCRDIVNHILEEAWLDDGRLRDREYWNKSFKQLREEKSSADNSDTECEHFIGDDLRHEYSVSYTANMDAVRYCPLDAASVWDGYRSKTPEFIMRYIPEEEGRRYFLMEYHGLGEKILLQKSGISQYEADQADKHGINEEIMDNLYTYMKKFFEAIMSAVDEHRNITFGEYTFSWFSRILMIKHEAGRVLLIRSPQREEDCEYIIRDADGLIISIPRLIKRLIYQEAEMLCLCMAKKLIKFGIDTISVKGCRILAAISDSDDMENKELNIKLRIDKYRINPEFILERSAYGSNE